MTAPPERTSAGPSQVDPGTGSSNTSRPVTTLTAAKTATYTPATDAAPGPFIQTYLAHIYMLSGDLDKSVAILRPLLTFPSWITPAELASDSLWAPLRAHPGFASLTAVTP